MQNNDLHMLKQLASPYFADICSKILDDYLFNEGFARVEIDDICAISYQKGDCRLEFSHWPEDSPNYFLMVGVGLVELVQGKSYYRSVGLWFAIPKDDIKCSNLNYGFASADELESILTELKGSCLLKYAVALCNDRQQLVDLLEKWERQQTLDYSARLLEQKLQDARRAFSQGNYTKAIELYSLIDQNNLTDSDKLRIRISRKKC